MKERYSALCVLAAALLVSAWIGSGQQPPRARSVGDDVLRNAGRTGEEWPSHGLTPGETRCSPLKQIDASNVGRLGLAWSYEVGPGGGNQEATPLMANGTIYNITNWSIVYAVDARTGQEKWRWDPEINRAAVRPKMCCGVVNRGVALYEDKIIAPINDGRLVALDAGTGRPVWESRVAYSQDNYTLTMAPRIAKGKVIIGVAGGEFPTRGFFEAHDARTGQFVWRFYTVPGDPSQPFENDAMRKAAATWDPEGLKMGGGASVWDAMSYDPDADLFYVGTGNAGPWSIDVRKQRRDKDNLYAASIIAVKPDTGKLAWYFQVVPGDDWDYDSVQHLMLADVTIQGRQRKVLMQANKDGFFYVIDRVTGEFIYGQPFARVTWARGLDEKTGRPIVNEQAYYGTQPVPISPSNGGAHNWAPMSFNPATGLVYFPASVNTSRAFAAVPSFKYEPQQMNTGVGRGAAVANLPRAPEPPGIGPVLAEGAPSSVLIAWDVANQKERWRAPTGGASGGGTVSTAGNLVIQVVPDGRLMAYSADKGEKLLELQTGLRGGMGPPITYMLDGRQYIALTGGLGGRPAANQEAEQGRAGAAQAPAQGNPQLLVFTLDGKAALPAASSR